MIAVTNSILQD